MSDSLAVAVDSTPEPGLLGSIASKVVAPARLVRRTFSSRSDRREYEAARAVAERATGYRVVVDIGDHMLYVIDGSDTLRTAPVATAMNTTLSLRRQVVALRDAARRAHRALQGQGPRVDAARVALRRGGHARTGSGCATSSVARSCACATARG